MTASDRCACGHARKQHHGNLLEIANATTEAVG